MNNKLPISFYSPSPVKKRNIISLSNNTIIWQNRRTSVRKILQIIFSALIIIVLGMSLVFSIPIRRKFYYPLLDARDGLVCNLSVAPSASYEFANSVKQNSSSFIFKEMPSDHFPHNQVYTLFDLIISRNHGNI